MALLIHDPDPREIALGARVLVGRGARCDLRIDSPRVSSEHAVLFWREGGWAVRDLGSRNGTFLDDAPVPPGAPAPVPVGARLRFGPDAWILRTGGPPDAIAVSGEQTVEGADGLLGFPDAETPTVTVFAAPNGRWLAEVDEVPRYIEDGSQFEVDGCLWRVRLPCGRSAREASTVAAEGARRAAIRFAVSQDEEYAEISAGGQALPSRAFHYLLLTLARLRLEHAGEGISEAEQGWVHVEDLCQMLDTDPQRINVDVYRARRQLASHGLCEPDQLVERRVTARQLRLGLTDFVVERL